MARPDLKVLISFTTAPLQTPSWTDISAYVDGQAIVSIQRGRQNELNRVEAGTATLTLVNLDRRFEPEYLSSPYYPNITPLRRIRIQATWQGVDYDLFDGYIESWEPEYLMDGTAICTVTASDAFVLLAKTPISSVLLLQYPWPASTTNVSVSLPFGNIVSLKIRCLSVGLTSSVTITLVGLRYDGAALSETITLGPSTPTVTSSNAYASVTYVTMPAGTAGATLTLIADVFPPEYVNDAINTVLTTIKWPSADRSIPSSATSPVMQSYTAGTDSALTVLQRLADSDAGTFLIGRDGKARFHPQTYAGTVSGLIFGDMVGGELPYESVSYSYDVDRIYNDIHVTRRGGTEQVVGDLTSQQTYYPRSLEVTDLLLPSDANALTLANRMLAYYKTPRMRMDKLVIRGEGGVGFLWTVLLPREIDDRVTVNRRPPAGGSVISRSGTIAAISMQISGHDWVITWSMGAVVSNPFTLNDIYFGVLDSTNVLS